MTLSGIWAELGIPPTDDASAIRRAYAARLKAVRPDADPQGFARLRDAYERALQRPGAVEPPAASEPKRSVPEASVPHAAIPAEVAAIAGCIRHNDVTGAAARLAAARTDGVLSLRQDMALADQLGWALAQNRDLPARSVREAADRLGWLAGTPAAPWAAALRSRLDAEQWLETLQRQAAARWPGAWHARSVAARMLLGRGKVRALPAMGSDPTLRRRYGEFLLYAGTVGDQFDPVRIDSVAALLSGRPGPARSWLRRWTSRIVRTIGAIFAATVLAGIVGGIIGGIVEDAVPSWHGAATGLITLGLYALTLSVGAVRWWWRRRTRR